MPLLRPLWLTVACLGFAACRNVDSLSPALVGVSDGPALTVDAPAGFGATGGGYYDVGGLAVQFAFTAAETPGGGKAVGRFHVFADEGDGLTVDVAGEVICVAVDPVNHHAWIGAVVTRNSSTDPDLQTDIHEVGDDVWFRVLDSGEGAGASEDRTSFIGFKGAAGIETSPEYCAARLWPADNARTWPVTRGNISVRP